MFSIRLLPPAFRGLDGQRLGEIVIGDIREVFSCYPGGTPIDDLPIQWRAELALLVSGKSVALLRHDPRFAWVVYREGDDCFIQERFSTDGQFRGLMPRIVTTEEGEAVSEWVTSLAAVRHYLDTEPTDTAPQARSGG
jgi:hypothetical protein